jgi:hypothetical protein
MLLLEVLFYREDGLQSKLELRTYSTSQERRRNSSTQGGRHVVCQDGPADEET